MKAVQKAVGFVTQNHLNPEEHGLGSISHPAPVAAGSAKAGTVGELDTWGGEEGLEEDETLTLAQL